MSLLVFSGALLLSLAFVPLVLQWSVRYGRISQPRSDRWHHAPTPTLGGIAIFAAFGISALVGTFALPALNPGVKQPWGIIVGATLAFCLGLYDDFRHIRPAVKLFGQVLIAVLVVSLGFTTDFFTPRLDNVLAAELLNRLLTVVWLVGITNAINLLDNMDGLAGGIAFITAVTMGLFFWRAGNLEVLLVAAALAGSVLGFLRYNFPPARIFMGDCGSQFLGFTLAVLAIAWLPQASGVFAIVAVPTLLFMLPILDTALVTFSRVLRGVSPVQGGRDHTSHRLVASGLTEKQTVVFLYSIAIISGATSILVETIGYWTSVIMLPGLVVVIAILAAYLSGMRVRAVESHSRVASTASREPNLPAPNAVPLAPIPSITAEQGVQRVLICASPEASRMVVAWLEKSNSPAYQLLGLIVPDGQPHGESIAGLVVWGSFQDLTEILSKNSIDGVFLALDDLQPDALFSLQAACQAHNCWVKRLRLDVVVSIEGVDAS